MARTLFNKLCVAWLNLPPTVFIMKKDLLFDLFKALIISNAVTNLLFYMHYML